MRILLVSYEYGLDSGGLSFACSQFHTLLGKLGHTVILASSNNKGCKSIHGGYDPALGYSISYENALKDELHRAAKSDLIIAFGGGFNAYYASILAQKAKRPFWIMFRGSDANLCKWDIERLIQTQFAVKNANRIIALSNEIADNIQLLEPCNRNIEVIPNHAAREKSELIRHNRDYILIGTGAAHLNEKKGILYLIRIMWEIKHRYPKHNVILELAGSIDSDVQHQYEEEAMQLGVHNKIKFLGGMSRDNFRKRQKLWDAYIQTSICEGMGNSVVESMSLGLPVLISDTGFVAEYARSRCTDILLPVHSSEIAADSILRVLTDEEALRRINRFYASFFEAISEKKVCQKWQQILNQVNKPTPQLPSGILAAVFHDVDGEINDHITIPNDGFKRFVEEIAAKGYFLCSMRKFMTMSKEERRRSIVCTFDDAYVGVFENALPVMSVFGFSATVFVCTEYIGKDNFWNLKDKRKRVHMDSHQLAALQANGWEIGSHGVNHCSLLKLNEVELEKTLINSKTILEDILGQPVHSYAYPYGDSNPFIQKQVGKLYSYAFLLSEGGTYLEVDSHKIRRYFVSEIYKILNLR